MRIRQKSKTLPFFLKQKSLRHYPLAAIGFIVGIGVGGHFFEAPPPPLYHFENKLQIQNCFTPDQRCLPLLIQEIDRARSSILMQAYSLTSLNTSHALIRAKKRGVDVRLIADKSQETSSYSQVRRLSDAGIKVQIDSKVAIAHRKLIIIDHHTIIGGSYNFSQAAENSNAEIMTIIKNRPLAEMYEKAWMTRSFNSRPLKIKQ